LDIADFLLIGRRPGYQDPTAQEQNEVLTIPRRTAMRALRIAARTARSLADGAIALFRQAFSGEFVLSLTQPFSRCRARRICAIAPSGLHNMIARAKT
jgi:hypothetical protein